MGRLNEQWGKLIDSESHLEPAIRARSSTVLAEPALRTPEPCDAVELLSAEHRALDGLFFEYERALTRADRKALLAHICRSLSVQLRIEEEIFYPALRTAWLDVLRMPVEARGHAGLKSLIEQLQDIAAFADLPTALVGALAEAARGHMHDARTQLFPQAKASALDLRELGARMAWRREELMTERRA